GNFSGGGAIIVNNHSTIDINGSASIINSIAIKGTLGYFMLNVGNGNTVTLGDSLTVDTLNLKTGTLVLNKYLSINGDIAASGSGTLYSGPASSISIATATSPSGSLA